MLGRVTLDVLERLGQCQRAPLPRGQSSKVAGGVLLVVGVPQALLTDWAAPADLERVLHCDMAGIDEEVLPAHLTAGSVVQPTVIPSVHLLHHKIPQISHWFLHVYTARPCAAHDPRIGGSTEPAAATGGTSQCRTRGSDPARMPELHAVADEVWEGLWVSGMPQADWDISGWDIDLVVSLCATRPPQTTSRYTWESGAWAAGPGSLVFLHWSFDDGLEPDLRIAELLAGYVVVALRAGHQVLLHSQSGRNRAPFLAALVIRQLTGCSGSDAADHLRARRAGILPSVPLANCLRTLPAHVAS